MDHSSLYEICTCCKQGKIEELPLAEKKKILILGILFLIPFAFALHAIAGISFLKFANKAVPLKSPLMAELLISGLACAIVAGIAQYGRIPRKIHAWLQKDCPYCEDGYIIKNKRGMGESLAYFLDIFLFEQILIPMYKTLTFQRFWKEGRKEKGWLVLSKLVFYVLLFFGSVPFLVFLLGNNRIIALLFSFFVVGYVVYMIFASKEEERDYQKSILFLLVPLYYVSMVEIFRWAWILSPASLSSIIPDSSDFLWMGLENLIRTQIFLDLFEVYSLRMGDIEATSFLAHSAIFLTRLLLDIALISLLIRAAMESYRRTWIFKNTGKKTTDVTQGELLIHLENLAVVGKPDSIHEVRDSLEKITKVMASIKEYVSGVFSISTEEKQRLAAQECSAILDKTAYRQEEKQEKQQRSSTPKERILAAACVFCWAFLFSVGIQYFIKHITAIEIQRLKQEAASERMKNDPIGRKEIYLKILHKDPKDQEAMLLCSRSYTDLADLSSKLFDLDQALVHIDKSFQKAMDLQKIIGLGKHAYSESLSQIEAQNYFLRGKVFFLKKDAARAISELKKAKNENIRRFLCSLYLYHACDVLFEGKADSLIETAQAELGFDPDYSGIPLISFSKALSKASQSKLDETISFLEQGLLLKTSSEIQDSFSIFAGNAFLRRGKDFFPKAEKYFQQILVKNPSSPDALLGMANLLRLQGDKSKELKAVLSKLMESSQRFLPLAQIQLALCYLQEKQPEEAIKWISKSLSQYSVRERYILATQEYFASRISEEQWLDAAWSSDMQIADRQRSLCYFYMGVQQLAQKNTNKAMESFRKCLSLKHIETAEYHQAKREMENIQIEQEGRTYQPELFLEKEYLVSLRNILQAEIQSFLFSEKDAIDGLRFLLGTKYTLEKQRAIQALTLGKAISAEKYLPLLKEAFKPEDSETPLPKDLHLAILESLAGLGPIAKEASAEVMDSLKSEEDLVRRAAIKVMASFGKESIEFLAKALEDSDKYVRRDAGYALAKLSQENQDALPALAKKLYDPEVMVRDSAFAAIKEMGEKGVPAILELIFKSQDTGLRLSAIKEVGQNYPEAFKGKREEILPVLTDILLKDPDPQSQRWAALRLLMLKAEDRFLDQEKVVPALLQRMKESLEESDPQSRLLCAGWYLQCVERWNAAMNPIIDIVALRLSQGNSQDREMVGEFFLSEERLGPATIKLLCSLLSYSNIMVRETARKTLEKLQRSKLFDSVASSFVQEVCHAILHGDKESQKVAQDLLKECQNQNQKVMSPILLPLLSHSQASIRSAALFALQIDNRNIDSLPSPQEQEILSKAILSATPEILKTLVRVAYAYKLKSSEILPVYLKLSISKDPSVAASAIKAMSHFQEERGKIIPHLEKILKSIKQNASQEEDESEEEEGSPWEKVQESVLFTWGALEGLDALLTRCQKDSKLQETAISVIPELMVHTKGLNSHQETAMALARFLEDKNPQIVLLALDELEDLKKGLEAIVPVLQKLEASGSKNVRSQAGSLLFRISPPKNLTEILPWLSSSNMEVKLAAMKALQNMAEKATQAIPHLIAKLGDSQSMVAMEAAKTLALLAPDSITPLEALLSHKSPKVQMYAIQSFGFMGQKARPALSKLLVKLQDKEVKLTEVAMENIVKILAPEDSSLAMKALETWMMTPKVSEKARLDGWVGIYKLGETRRALQEIIRILEETAQQQYAVKKLMEIDPDYTVSYLRSKLRERYGKINAEAALKLLAEMKDKARPALDYIQELTHDPNPDIRKEASLAASQIETKK
ncbi:MAG: HEAT repeat domain-containing protein [Candidatus Brocadiae bacterium]|nr:HEAT repeat domain-containing protein [Candidatus Brocadiia bacterium]